MGEIVVNIGLENFGSWVRRGISQEPVRRTRVDGIVDTGGHAGPASKRRRAARAGAIENRGRHLCGRAQGGKAGGGIRHHRGVRPLHGHGMYRRSAVEPPLGQVVLEMLDLIADPTNRTLEPRMPLPAAEVGTVEQGKPMGTSSRTRQRLGPSMVDTGALSASRNTLVGLAELKARTLDGTQGLEV